jgi:hypothetical protein
MSAVRADTVIAEAQEPVVRPVQEVGGFAETSLSLLAIRPGDVPLSVEILEAVVAH